MRFFQEPIQGDWVYPCDVAELERRYRLLPEDDLRGLWALGLACSTEKHHARDGCYYFGDKPTILLYSTRSDYRYKQPPGVREKDVDHAFVEERAYGMRVDKVGSRFWCCWEPEQWNEFVLDYVLAHEVGHHVFWMRYKDQVQDWGRAQRNASERFAEKYGRDHSRFRELMHNRDYEY